MKLGDIIKLHINPATGYEINPEELVPNGGKWTEINENEYEQGGLVKDIIGTSIRMRQKSPSKYKVNIFINTDDRGYGTITDIDGGIVVGSGEYYVGEQVTIGAIANDGYEFTHWNDGETQTPRVIFVDHDVDFVANFKRIQLTHTINVAVTTGQEEYGNVSGGGTGYPGDEVRIMAIPNEGYEFVQWLNDHVREYDRFVNIRDFDETYIAEFTRKQYKIEVRPNSPVMGETTGGGVYNTGEIVTLTAIPYTGYVFDHWNDGSMENPHNIIVKRNMLYTAFFKPEQPTTARITVKSEDETMGYTDPAGTQEYPLDSVITINAIPNDGFEFRCWQDGNTEIHRDITVTGFAEYIACFQHKIIDKYRLILKCDPPEGGTVMDHTTGGDGSGIYPINTECEVVADPADGYTFDGWYIDGEDEPESRNLVYIFRLETNLTLVAKFTRLPDPPKYRIAVTPHPEEGGWVEGENEYYEGSTCAVWADPSNGYHFIRWTENDEEVSTQQRYEFQVTRNRDLIAEFERDSGETHTVTAQIVTNGDPSNPNGGTITGAGDYSDGDTCYLDAYNNRWYDFVGWFDINDELLSSSSDYSFTVTEDVIIYGKFKTHEVSQFLVTVDSDPSGYATTGGGGTFNSGELVTVYIRLESIPTKYEFIGWQINDTFKPTSSDTWSFVVVGDTTVTAVLKLLEPKEYTIETSVNPEGSGNISGGGQFIENTTCTLIATHKKGYVFNNWTENGNIVSNNATYEFTVTNDRSLVANFTEATSQYTISTRVDPSEGGYTTGGGSYSNGETCTLNAIPNDNYEFVNWTEDGAVVSSNASYSFTIDRNRTLVANFTPLAPTSYAIEVSVNPIGGGSVTGGGNYAPGTDCRLEAIVADGYEFVNWTENEIIVSTNAIFQFNVDRNRSLIANFNGSTPTKYHVSTSVDPTNGGTVTGAGDYSADAYCTIEATPNTNAGYSFAGWTINGTSVSEQNGKANPYTFKVDEDKNVVAYFEKLHTVTVRVKSKPDTGTVSGGGTYVEGTQATVNAMPAEGFHFVHWKEGDNVVSSNASYSFTVTSDITLDAYFENDSYSITVEASPSNGGSVTGGATYNYGVTATVTATPNANYRFSGWQENGSIVSTETPYTFKVENNRTLTAIFESTSPSSYNVSTSVDPTGSGTVTGGGSHSVGSSVTLTATANTGYTFNYWIIDGDTVNTNPYTFTPNNNINVKAYFTKIQYAVNIGIKLNGNIETSSSAAGTINGSAGTVSGGGSNKEYGTDVVITAEANSGYVFDHWEVNNVEKPDEREDQSSNHKYTINSITSNTTVYACFLKQYTVGATVDPKDSGNVSGTGTYSYGQSVTLTAEAASGYTFVHWENTSGAIIGTNTTYTISSVIKDTTVKAVFEQNTYEITVNASPAEGGSVSGGGTYIEGVTATVTATANASYNFVHWKSNDTIVSTNASYSFTVNGTKSLMAIFTKKHKKQYTVTTGIKLNGNVETSGASSTISSTAGIVNGGGSNKDSGANVVITAVANNGYVFDHWEVNNNEKPDERTDQSSDHKYTIQSITGDTIIYACFLKQYDVEATVDPSGGGTVSGTGTYNYGQSVTLIASAASGYTFSHWENSSHENIGSNTTYVISGITENTTVKACFNVVISSYNITTSVDPSGSGVVSGGGSHEAGKSATIEATANTGYTFDHWVIDRNTVNTNPYTFTLNNNVDAKAYFTKNQYTVTTGIKLNGNVVTSGTTGTISSDAGTVSGGGSNKEFDTNVAITAVANSGYVFDHWEVGGEEKPDEREGQSSNHRYTVNSIASDTTIYACFLEQYNVDVTIKPSDSGIVSGARTYNYGQPVNLTANANNGYTFNHWEIGDENVGSMNPYTIASITDDVDIIAVFSGVEPPTQYTITTVSNPNKGGSTTGDGTYNAGTILTVIATAEEGYEFDHWEVSGESVSTDASYTFKVDSSITITAIFTGEETGSNDNPTDGDSSGKPKGETN